jgi:hypothetical protein
MKIAFHSEQLAYRGTEVAMYDYAKYNEEILGNESIIIANADPKLLPAYDKFKKRFHVELYDNFSLVDKICEKNKVDVFYITKSGENDGKICKSCKTAVHAVFAAKDPHGQVYAYISEWLSNFCYNGHMPYVPYMVEKNPEVQNLRQQLNIKKDAIVLGYHGGHNSFNINFVQQAVYEHAHRNPNVYFLFLGAQQFCPQMPNIIHFPYAYDLSFKGKFINTCDAMLHARDRGETFGLSIAEFSCANKPVITWYDSPERQHIEILEDVGIYYSNKEHIDYILQNIQDLIQPNEKKYDVYSQKFSPKNVMQKFDQVFIK